MPHQAAHCMLRSMMMSLTLESAHRGVGVCEDDGQNSYDRHSGLAATDGMWRHIAVTWRSDTGRAILYEKGRNVFTLVPKCSACTSLHAAFQLESSSYRQP